MHIAEVVTIAKSLPLLRLNTYKSLILSYSADYRRIFRKNISKAGKVVSQVRCDFNEKGYQWWEFRYKTILLPGGGYKSFQNWLTVFI